MAVTKTAVAIIGVGSVGATLGYALINQGLCDEIYLVDKNTDKARAEATDLENCIEFMNRNMHIQVRAADELADADIAVLTAAAPYGGEQTRLDMLSGSLKIIDSIVPDVIRGGFSGHFVVITNPVDIISWRVLQLSGFPANRIIGTGTALDSARLKNVLSRIVDVDPRSIHAFTMGEHGESQMIPWSAARIGGKLWNDVVRDNPGLEGMEDSIHSQVVGMAFEIIRGKGSTNYGIASSTAGIIKAILHDENRIIPVCAMLTGQYGHSGIFISVPAVINRTGIKEIVEIKLTDREQAEFDSSAGIIREYISGL